MTENLNRIEGENVKVVKTTNFVDYINFSESGKSAGSVFFDPDFGAKGGRSRTVRKQSDRRNRRCLWHIGASILTVGAVLAFWVVLSFGLTAVVAQETQQNGAKQTNQGGNETTKIDILNVFSWETDYEFALQKAKAASQNLLIYFYAEQDSPKLLNVTEEKYVQSGHGKIRQVSFTSPSMQKPLPIVAACREFEHRISENGGILAGLDRHMLLKLPLDAKCVDEKGNEVTILEQPMFREMEKCPGFAVIDFENPEASYYGDLVGILPFIRAKLPTMDETLTFLSLPAGSLTQRTLIYAVRIHGEKPRSALGEPHPTLLQECNGHSAYQAKTGVLGHQNFGARSSRIAAVVGRGASEVCAQSWSGEGLYEAAIGCVRAWRGSSGHWKGVRAPNVHYGYDMVRGRNGIWYATGLFVK